MKELYKDIISNYYTVEKLWWIDYENIIYKIEQKISNNEGYKISKIWNNKYFIHFVRKHVFEIMPKKWKNDDVNTLESLNLDEWQNIYSDVYAYLEIWNISFFSQSIWILSVIQPWREVSLKLLWLLFNEIFDLEKSCIVEPIKILDKEKYIKNVKKIESFTFTVSTVESQQQLSQNEVVQKVWWIKEAIWAKWITMTLTDKDWINKNKLFNFIEWNENIFSHPPRIQVTDVWEHISQQLDRIRYKSKINVKINEWDFDFDDVLNKMKIDFESIKKLITSDYENSK